MKNFKKLLLTLTNVLKSSTELKNFLAQLKKNLLKNKLSISNGNASETKANESFDNGVFFDIEAKRTPSIGRKLFSKRSKHIR
jgi:hypothetical protein